MMSTMAETSLTTFMATAMKSGTCRLNADRDCRERREARELLRPRLGLPGPLQLREARGLKASRRALLSCSAALPDLAELRRQGVVHLHDPVLQQGLLQRPSAAQRC